MKAAAIYARVSTQGQAKDGTSLDTQTDACRAHAQEQGYIVVKEVREDWSGVRLDRPGLDSVRDMAAKGEIQAVVVFDVDRLSRSLAHQMLLVEEFERARVEVIFVNAPREDTPEGRMLFGLKGLFAEYERTKILERTRRGKEKRLRDGKVLGSPMIPFGYIYVPERACYVVDQERAEWVRQIFEWVGGNGLSMYEVARRLNAAGVPTARGAFRWGPTSVHALVTNETYLGMWHWNKHKTVEPRRPRNEGQVRRHAKSSKVARPRAEWFKVPVPAIVSEELFAAAQKHLQRNKEVSLRNCRRSYMLRGRLFCAFCGRRLVGYAPHGHRYYQCPRHVARPHIDRSDLCPFTSIKADTIEDAVWREVENRISRPEVLHSILIDREAEVQKERAKANEELAALYTVEESLQRDAARLIDLHLTDVIDRDMLQGRLALIKRKQESVARAKAEAQERIARQETARGTVEALEMLCKRVQAALPYVTNEDKQAFLDAADVRTSTDGQSITIHGLISNAILAPLGISGAKDRADGKDGNLHAEYRSQIVYGERDVCAAGGAGPGAWRAA